MAEVDSGQHRSPSSRASKSTSQKAAPKSRSNGRAPAQGGASKAKASSTRARQKASSTRARQRSSQASRGRSARPSNGRSARPSNGRSTVESVTEAVSSGAQSTADFARKAKGPLIAGGVAIAGLGAGAAALNGRSGRRKVLGVKMPRSGGLGRMDVRKALKKVDARRALSNTDARTVAGSVTDAANRADRFGRRVSSVANSVRTVSETAEKAAKNG